MNGKKRLQQLHRKQINERLENQVSKTVEVKTLDEVIEGAKKKSAKERSENLTHVARNKTAEKEV